MTHETTFNIRYGIIEVKLTGNIPFDEIREVIYECTALAKENHCLLWMTDYSEATPQVSTTEIYELPKLFAAAAVELDVLVMHVKRAIVVSNKNIDYLFAKTISDNRGQSLDLFTDVDSARKWLINDHPSH